MSKFEFRVALKSDTVKGLNIPVEKWEENGVDTGKEGIAAFILEAEDWSSFCDGAPLMICDKEDTDRAEHILFALGFFCDMRGIPIRKDRFSPGQFCDALNKMGYVFRVNGDMPETFEDPDEGFGEGIIDDE